MGYRSDVRIITSKKGYKVLRDYVNKNAVKYRTPDYDFNLMNRLDILKETPDGTQVMFGWSYIKWYDGQYEDVDLIIEALNHLSENQFNWRMTRIGESYDDIEEDYYDGSQTDTELEWPWVIRDFDDEGAGFTIDKLVKDSE